MGNVCPFKCEGSSPEVTHWTTATGQWSPAGESSPLLTREGVGVSLAGNGRFGAVTPSWRVGMDDGGGTPAPPPAERRTDTGRHALGSPQVHAAVRQHLTQTFAVPRGRSVGGTRPPEIRWQDKAADPHRRRGTAPRRGCERELTAVRMLVSAPRARGSGGFQQRLQRLRQLAKRPTGTRTHARTKKGFPLIPRTESGGYKIKNKKQRGHMKAWRIKKQARAPNARGERK